MPLSLDAKRELIDSAHPGISVRRQCDLLDLNRSSFYNPAWREPARESGENLLLMRKIDEQYTETPFYGSRQMASSLRMDGFPVDRHRVQRLMRTMGLRGVAPGPDTSRPNRQHPVYPYLLRGLVIEKPDHVWSTDITYIPMKGGFMYLIAVMDWGSRYVLSWKLSNSLDVAFCLAALHGALERSRPQIFNTDQGSQYTSDAFTSALKEAGIRISMDGRGRALDNVFIERLWRAVKYECVYLHNFETVPALAAGLAEWFHFYNEKRPHSALGRDLTPKQVYFRQDVA